MIIADWLILNTPLVSAALSVIVGLALWKTSGIQNVVARLLTVGVFPLYLYTLWVSKISSPMFVGGLIPWSDAAGYLTDALLHLSGNFFSDFSCRRPEFASTLSSVLKHTHYSLKGALLVFCLFNGWMILTLLQELKLWMKTWHWLALVFFMLSQFYFRFIGTTLTEQLGFPLGILSLIYFLKYFRKPHAGLIFISMLALMLGLYARAGAFFMIPCFFGWLILMHRSWAMLKYPLLAGMAAVALAYGLHRISLKSHCPPGIQTFSNFSFTIYGQVTGGKGWTQIFRDFPDAATRDEAKLSQFVLEKSREHFREHPLDLLKGLVKSYLRHLVPKGSGAFSFIDQHYEYRERIWFWVIRALLTALMFISLFFCWKKRKTPMGSFFLLFAGSIFLSLPFLPGTDTDHARVWAVSNPFLIVLTCLLGSSWATDTSKRESRKSTIFVAVLFLIVAGSLAQSPHFYVKNMGTCVFPVSMGSTVQVDSRLMGYLHHLQEPTRIKALEDQLPAYLGKLWTLSINTSTWHHGNFLFDSQLKGSISNSTVCGSAEITPSQVAPFTLIREQ